LFQIENARNNNPSKDNGNQNYESQDVVFTATSKNGKLSDDIWICDSGACGHNDWCVANKSIDGKQCTIVCHVDDLNISHVYLNVVTSMVEKLDKEL
jgi:hypothetical protein